MERLGQKLKSGELKDIVAVPTSIRTKEQAESLGIPLVTLDTHSGKTQMTMNEERMMMMMMVMAKLMHHDVCRLLFSVGCGHRWCR